MNELIIARVHTLQRFMKTHLNKDVIGHLKKNGLEKVDGQEKITSSKKSLFIDLIGKINHIQQPIIEVGLMTQKYQDTCLTQD